MLRASALLGVVLVLGLGSRARAQDLANGKDVFGTCAACHGSNGIRNVLAYLTSVQDLGEETPDVGRPEREP